MLARIAADYLNTTSTFRLLPGSRRQWLAFTAAVLVGIAFLSVTAVYRVPSAFGLDKLGHAVAYGVLMSGLMHVFARRWWLALAIVCCALAVAFEGVQSLMPYRTVSLWDILASAVGVVFAYARAGRSG
jgi:VanZ family protein